MPFDPPVDQNPLAAKFQIHDDSFPVTLASDALYYRSSNEGA
jgi:hypothetical protein